MPRSYNQVPAIQHLPINSAILSPADGSSVSEYDDEVTVKGYAVAGGGRAVVRVDVSADGGETWTTAELKPTGQPLYRYGMVCVWGGGMRDRKGYMYSWVWSSGHTTSECKLPTFYMSSTPILRSLVSRQLARSSKRANVWRVVFLMWYQF